MIAIPVLKRSGGMYKNLNLFTRAQIIALVAADGNIEYLEHGQSSGRALAELLIGRGVKTLICNHLGSGPYQLLVNAGVELVYRDGSMELEPLLELYRKGELASFEPSMVHASQGHGQGQSHGQGHGQGGRHDCDCQ